MRKNEWDFIELTFNSRVTNEVTAISAVLSFVSGLKLTIEERGDIKSVTTAAINNALIHSDSEKISVRAAIIDGNVLEIRVRDWGCGIDDVVKARQPHYTTIVGFEGMGFTIMESFMDSVMVRSTPGKGTTVTMRRRIS